jgi:hypothetical protein
LLVVAAKVASLPKVVCQPSSPNILPWSYMTDYAVPPRELMEQWVAEIWHEGTPVRVALSDDHIAARAAQWGADQELEACCQWVAVESIAAATELRAARRPKPPSWKEQALNGLEKVESFTLGQLSGVSVFDEYKTHVDNIRRALKALPE